MRSFLLPLLLLACTSAAAQNLALQPADLVNAERLARAMPALARAAMAHRQPGPDGEAERIWRMRLQLVAGDDAGALASIAALRAASPPQAAAAPPAFLQYEIYARARQTRDRTFAAAFGEQFRDAFAQLDDRRAYRGAQAFAYSLPQSWDSLQRVVAGLKFADDGLPLEQALQLLGSYQPYQAYSAMLPLTPALLDADELSRYQRDQLAITGPDGLTLSAFVVRPRSARQPLPTAMVFTIYAEADRPWREAVQAAAYGYAGVVAFSRGKVASKSPVEPYEHEVRDVNTVIDWVSRQPWSNGAVGMYGGSYNGFAQWAALKNPHPALKTIVPYVAAIPGLGLPMENNVGLTANYGWAAYVGSTPYLDETNYNDRKRWDALTERWYRSGRPYREIDQLDGQPNPWLQRWLKHPAYDAYWQAMVPYGRKEYARIDIPVLSITGYYDDGQISAIEYLKQHEAHHPNPNHVLLIGPYDHVGAQRPFKTPLLRGYAIDPVAQFDTPAITFEWLDHVLRGGPRPALLKERINYQLMGANRWEHAPSLRDLHRKPTRFYLRPAGGASAPNRLSPDRPPAGARLEQVVDFKDRSSSGNSYYPWPILRRELDQSSGHVFVSEPLPAARRFAGSFSGELRISINKRDVDLGVVLYELTPEGDYLHLSYFLGRASFADDMSRRRLLKPGQISTVRFSRTRMAARELRAGSRLVVQVNVNKNEGAQVNMGSGKDVSDESLRDAGTPLRIRWHGDSFVDLPLQ
jgi:putative CocE/NonD family hydrolase